METSVKPRATQRGEMAIIVGSRDAEALRRIVARHGGRVAQRLGAALERAIVLPQARLPPEVVSLGSTVVVELCPGLVRELVVVEPWLAYGGRGHVSVLDPLGAALLGATEGEAVEVEPSPGAAITIRIVAVNPEGGAA